MTWLVRAAMIAGLIVPPMGAQQGRSINATAPASGSYLEIGRAHV